MNVNRTISRGLISGVLITMAVHTSAFGAIEANVLGNNVNVRKDSSKNSEIVKTLNSGQEILVNYSGQDFYNVFVGGNDNVFISKGFVDVNNTVKIKGDNINIRNSASTNGAIIGKSNNGNIFTIKGIEGEWCLIDYNGANAYIHISFLTSQSPMVAEAHAPSEAVVVSSIETVVAPKTAMSVETVPAATVAPVIEADVATETYAIVNSSTGLNLRVSPSKDAEVVLALSKGNALKVLRVDGEWAQVSFNDKIGYVNTEFIALNDGPVPIVDNSNVGKAQEIIAYAEQFLGTPYVYGGTSLNKGVDCSGFIYSVMKNFEIHLGRSSRDMYHKGTPVSKADLQPGDLVFFAEDGSKISHVAIYIGDGKYIHSTDGKGNGISYANLNSEYSQRTYYGAKRII